MSTPRARCPYCLRRVGMTHNLQCPAMRLGRIVRLPLPAPEPPAPLLPATPGAPDPNPAPKPTAADQIAALEQALSAARARHAQDVKELNERLEKRAMDYLHATRRDTQRLLHLEVENEALRQQLARLTPSPAAA